MAVLPLARARLGKTDAGTAHLQPCVGRRGVEFRVGSVRALSGQNIARGQQRKRLFRRIVILGGSKEIGLRPRVEYCHRIIVRISE